MYNTDIPNREELPSTAKLIRSTIIAAIVALILLVTVVMPAEYALDPTGAGRLLGLTEMGEIKEQLADEAAADEEAQMVAVQSSSDQQETEAVQPEAEEPAQEAAPEPEPEPAAVQEQQASEPAPAETQWQDEVRVVLTPGEGTEFKLTMEEVLWLASLGYPRVAQSTLIPMAMEAASQFHTRKAGAYRKTKANWKPLLPATMAGSSETGMTMTLLSSFVPVETTDN